MRSCSVGYGLAQGRGRIMDGIMGGRSKRFIVAASLLVLAFLLHAVIVPLFLVESGGGVSAAILGGAYLAVTSILLASMFLLRSILRDATRRA